MKRIVRYKLQAALKAALLCAAASLLTAGIFGLSLSFVITSINSIK